MNKLKQAIGPILVALLLVGALAGCARIDYAVFKAKYQSTTVSDYIWDTLTKK